MQRLNIHQWSSANLEINGNLNNATYNHYFTRAFMLATVMYKWDNLPNNIAKRFIENNLFWYGNLAFYKDPEKGFMVAKCNQSGMLNFYDEPISYHCYGTNGYNRDVKADECVIIRNNIMELPTCYLIDLFCQRIADITRTIDVNVFQQKMPKLFTCEETQRLTLKNLLMKVSGNEPYIVGNKALNVEQLDVLDTTAPYVADKLTELKKNLWYEMLEMLGIKNSNVIKKERLVTDETNANNQLTEFQSDIMLMTRQFAVEEINKKFDLNITCELREQFQTKNDNMNEGVQNE